MKFLEAHNAAKSLPFDGDGFSNADFSKAQAVVKINEGGYQAMASDSGNYVDGQLIGTKYGISAPTLKTYLGRTPTVADMQNLTYDTALKIYKKNYWDTIQGDTIKNDSIALSLYDFAVNAGVGSASKVVGSSLGINTGIPFSATTINKINSANQQTLFNDIKTKKEDYYKSLGGSFLNSWLKRVESITYSGAQSIKAHPIITLAVTAVLIFSAYFLITTKKK